MDRQDLIYLTTDIVTAYVGNNQVETVSVGRLVTDIHGALSSLGQRGSSEEAPAPFVSVRSSVKKDHLICLVCGEKKKMLKRHLRVQHDMAPHEYRAAYNLPEAYPLVAKEYAERRRDFAKKIGLGRQPGQKRGRKPASKSSESSANGKRSQQYGL